jgi:hypothetical protein
MAPVKTGATYEKSSTFLTILTNNIFSLFD